MVKLPFWRTVGDAYRFVFTQPLTILRAGWAFLAIDLVYLSVQFAGAKSSLILGVTEFISSILLMGAAVAWPIALARAILLGERSRIAALQFRYRHWRLIGVSLLLVLLIIVPMAIVGGATALAHPTGILIIPIVIVFLAFMLVAMAFIIRFYLTIPAIAVDDPPKAIRAAWRRGRGNTLRLFFGGLICTLPFLIILIIFWVNVYILVLRQIRFTNGGIALDPNNPFGTFFQSHPVLLSLISIAVLLFQLLGGAIFIAFYSLAYRQLAVNWNPPPAVEAPPAS